MDPINALYDKIAAGEAQPVRGHSDTKRLLSRARYSGRRGTLEERLAAVRVLSAVGGHWSMSVLRELVGDEEPAVRRALLAAALKEGAEGLTVLRDLAMDPDEAIALEVIGYLRRVVDRGSTGRMRRLLSAPSPRLRAAAVELLGHIAGPGMTVPLYQLHVDPDDAVRQAAIEAVERLEGEREKATPDPWWRQEEPPEWSPPQRVPMPETLPEETTDLLQLLGSVEPGDRAAIVAELKTRSERDLREAIRAVRMDATPELSQGVAICAQLLGRDGWVLAVRRMLPDRNPSVRIAAAEALAVIGKPSVVMGLRDLLTDAYPAVRLAGLHAMFALVEPDEARRYARAMHRDADEAVQEALAALLRPTADPEQATPAPTPESPSQ